jgi:hypothetical protein
LSDRILTDQQRAAADRRGADGSITSLVEARELLRRAIDRDKAVQLVTAVYLRGCERGDHNMIDRALDVARAGAFITRLVAPVVAPASPGPVNS